MSFVLYFSRLFARSSPPQPVAVSRCLPFFFSRKLLLLKKEGRIFHLRDGVLYAFLLHPARFDSDPLLVLPWHALSPTVNFPFFFFQPIETFSCFKNFMETLTKEPDPTPVTSYSGSYLSIPAPSFDTCLPRSADFPPFSYQAVKLSSPSVSFRAVHSPSRFPGLRAVARWEQIR